MRITSHKSLHQLTFVPRAFPLNCYLVERENSVILVDAGMPFCGKGIIRAAQDMDKPISHIVLTHGHQDHMGSVPIIKKQFPDAKICISKRDSALLEGDMSPREGESNNPIKGSIKPGLIIESENLLNDGDEVAGLHIISVPGHTPGSIAVYDEPSKALLCGDIFVSKGRFRLSGDTYPLFPFPDTATWDIKTSVVNAEKLLVLDIEILGTGHGNMVSNPINDMKQAIDRVKESSHAAK